MSNRLARQRRKDAVRQQKRRDTMAAARKPATHAVDAAIAQALAYTVVECWAQDQRRRDVVVPLRRVLDVAARILAHGGRYDWEAAARAVVARTRNRNAMRWTLDAPRRPEAE